MTGQEAAIDAARLEAIQARRPLPQQADTATRRAWESIAADADPNVIRQRRHDLLQATRDTP